MEGGNRGFTINEEQRSGLPDIKNRIEHVASVAISALWGGGHDFLFSSYHMCFHQTETPKKLLDWVESELCLQRMDLELLVSRSG